MLATRFPGNAATHLVLSIVTLLVSCIPQVVGAQALSLTIAKSFSPSTVVVGGSGTTTMTVTVTNPNGFAVSGIAFSDTYPAGLVPDQVGAYTCSAGSAVFTGSGWSLGNVTLGAGASCSVPMLMHASVAGSITNTTSQVTGTGVPAGPPASAVLNVNVPVAVVVPTLSESMLMLLAIAIAAMSIAAFRGHAGRR